DAHGRQLPHLVGAGRDHRLGAPADLALDADPLGRAAVGRALPPPLDGAERVVGLHHGDAHGLGGEQGGVPAHPEVGVHDVRPVGRPPVVEVRGELRHVRQQPVLGDGLRRPGGHVLDRDPGRHGPPVRPPGLGPPGVHRDLVAAERQGAGERGDMDVLPTGVHTAQRGERAGVLRDEGDPHGTHSFTVERRRTASTICSARTEERQGWPGIGQIRARLPRHGAAWSPRITAGTRYGAQRAAGTTGANRLTTGVPTAAARCAAPVLGATTTEAEARTAASSRSVVRPPRSTAPAAATRRVSARSPGPPVTTTRSPARTSAATASAHRSGGQVRAGALAPGWTATYPGGPARCRVSGSGPRTASRPSSPSGRWNPAARARPSMRSGSGTSTVSSTTWRTSSRVPG